MWLVSVISLSVFFFLSSNFPRNYFISFTSFSPLLLFFPGFPAFPFLPYFFCSLLYSLHLFILFRLLIRPLDFAFPMSLLILSVLTDKELFCPSFDIHDINFFRNVSRGVRHIPLFFFLERYYNKVLFSMHSYFFSSTAVTSVDINAFLIALHTDLEMCCGETDFHFIPPKICRQLSPTCDSCNIRRCHFLHLCFD